jgi:hypothetical protein
MSEDERFLSRWSRLKQETAKRAPAPADETASPPAGAAPAREEARAPVTAPDSEAAAVESFDPASLPPLDSIGAGSDIRAFLARGVPAELAQAALRRAWAADPAIRDFIGLSENSGAAGTRRQEGTAARFRQRVGCRIGRLAAFGGNRSATRNARAPRQRRTGAGRGTRSCEQRQGAGDCGGPVRGHAKRKYSQQERRCCGAKRK